MPLAQRSPWLTSPKASAPPATSAPCSKPRVTIVTHAAAAMKCASGRPHGRVRVRNADIRVRALFNSYGEQTGTLRLRHQTHCLRARVIKENLAREATPPDPTLIELS